MTVWVPTLGPRAAFLKPLCSKMLSFDMFFQEFRIPKGFLLSAPRFLCDSEQPQSAPGLTLNIWDAPRLLKSVFLSVSLIPPSLAPTASSSPRTQKNSPMYPAAIALFFQTSYWLSEGLEQDSSTIFHTCGEAGGASKMHRMPRSPTLYSRYTLENAFQKALWLISPSKPINPFIIHGPSLKCNKFAKHVWDYVSFSWLWLLISSSYFLLDVTNAETVTGLRWFRQLEVACSRGQCESLDRPKLSA